MSEENPTYKHILVPVGMQEAYEVQTIRRQTGTRSVQKVKGILKPEKVVSEEPVFEFVEEEIPTGELSNTDPNSQACAYDLEEACNTLDAEGYDVISITPILRGVHGHEIRATALKKGTGEIGHSFGFGYSITDALIVMGRRRDA